MNLQFKKVTKSLQQNEDICLRSHTALTREIINCIHSFPLPLTVNELIFHSTQIGQHHLENLSIIIRLKPKHLMRYDYMNSQIQIYGTAIRKE